MANGILDGLPGYENPPDDDSDKDVKVYSDANSIKSNTESVLDGLPVIRTDALTPEENDGLFFQIARGGGASLRHVQS